MECAIICKLIKCATIWNNSLRVWVLLNGLIIWLLGILMICSMLIWMLIWIRRYVFNDIRQFIFGFTDWTLLLIVMWGYKLVLALPCTVLGMDMNRTIQQVDYKSPCNPFPLFPFLCPFCVKSHRSQMQPE